MKRLVALMMIIGSSALALGPQTNEANVTIQSGTAPRFDQFSWNIGSYNDQYFSLNFDQSIAGSDTYFKMSQTTATNLTTYLYVTNLTVSTTNVSWSVARTNITMPLGVYLSEVYADDPTGSAQSIARGKITVSRSLFAGDDDILSPSVVTSLTSYVRKDGDFTQFSGLGGTSGQVWKANGSGGGSWGTDTGGSGITNIVGSTNLIASQSGLITTISLQDAVTNITSLQYAGGTGTQGKVSWNTDEETLDIIQDGAVLQVGQETQYHVRNNSGSDIGDGVPVYASGTLGASGRITIAPFIADGTIAAKLFLGATTESIPNGTDGKVTHFGKVRGISSQLTGFNDGDILYPSATEAGAWTNVAPAAPNIALPAGFVIDATPSGTIAMRVNNLDQNEFSTSATGTRSLDIIDCLPNDRPTFDYIANGTTVTGIVNTTDLDGDFVMNFASGLVTSSVPVYLTLDNGTTNSQQFQYIYVTPNGITNSTTFPTGEYAILFDLSLLDAAKTQTDGVFTLRRWTDKVTGPNGQNRSFVQRIAERVRTLPATWRSGGDLSTVVTTKGAANDDVYITTTTGTAYQMHKQTFSAITATNGTVEYHVYNDPDLTFNHITNLNQITKDSQGNTVLDSQNSYFNVAVLKHVASGTTNVVDTDIILNLSSGDYATEANALADASGKLDLRVPVDMVGETIVLGFVTLNRTSVGGGTWTATATSLLGTPVGGQGGGSSSLPGSSTFTDSAFKVVDDSDPTKIMQFQNSGITSGQTRTLTIPDASGIIFLASGAEPASGNFNMGGNSITNIGTQVIGNGQLLLQESSDPLGESLIALDSGNIDAIISTNASADFVVRTAGAGDHARITASGATLYDGLDLNDKAQTSTASIEFTTNSITQITGTYLTTNFVGWVDGTNTFMLLLSD